MRRRWGNESSLSSQADLFALKFFLLLAPRGFPASYGRFMLTVCPAKIPVGMANTLFRLEPLESARLQLPAISKIDGRRILIGLGHGPGEQPCARARWSSPACC